MNVECDTIKKIKNEKVNWVQNVNMWPIEFKFHSVKRRKPKHVFMQYSNIGAYCEKSVEVDWVDCFRFVFYIMLLIVFFHLLTALYLSS